MPFLQKIFPPPQYQGSLGTLVNSKLNKSSSEPGLASPEEERWLCKNLPKNLLKTDQDLFSVRQKFFMRDKIHSH